MSEIDLNDCLALIAHCEAAGDEIDRDRIRTAIRHQAPTDDPALAARRRQLLERLGSSSAADA